MKTMIGVTLLLLADSLFAQTTNISIYDSTGNQAVGTIINGNVYFNDSNGKSTFGTIRDGNIFLTTSKGEITLGTIRNGNVFLTDEKGAATGTIRDGNIFLNNSDGSTTIGTYDRNGVSTTTTATSTKPPSYKGTPRNSVESRERLSGRLYHRPNTRQRYPHSADRARHQ